MRLVLEMMTSNLDCRKFFSGQERLVDYVAFVNLPFSKFGVFFSFAFQSLHVILSKEIYHYFLHCHSSFRINISIHDNRPIILIISSHSNRSVIVSDHS